MVEKALLETLQFALDNESRVSGGFAVLLHGPTGTGKTTAVRNAARTLGKKPEWVTESRLFTEYAGEPHNGLAHAFRDARRQQTILVLENAEVLFATSSGDNALVSTFMCEMSQPGLAAVILIASNIDLLHPVISGSIQETILAEFPNQGERFEALKLGCSDASLDETTDLSTIAEQCFGYTLADCSALISRALTSGLQRMHSNGATHLTLSKEDFESALRKKVSLIGGIVAIVPSVQWDDIGGLAEVKQRLREAVVWFYTKQDAIQRLGIPASCGILLYGPPGTGKTLLAKAAATESKANFIAITVTDVVHSEVGESEKRIAAIFARARAASPCVVFLDEIQSMFGARGQASAGGQTMITQLMLELDALSTNVNNRVVVLAATNVPEALDPGLLRAGRFDHLVYVPPPDAVGRRSIITMLTQRTPLAADINIDSLLRDTDGFTGADLHALVRRAAVLSLQEGPSATLISATALANTHITPSVSRAMASRYEEFAKQHGAQVQKSLSFLPL